MNFTISKSDFLGALQAVSRAISNRNFAPIVACALISAESDGVVVTGSNLELRISAKAQAKVHKEGSVAIPFSRLIGFVSYLRDGEIEITCDDKNRVTIKSGSLISTINGLPAGEYPIMPVVSEKQLTLTQPALRAALAKTLFSMSAETLSRPVICGVLLEIKDKKLRFVSTDGRRITVVESETELPDASLTIPAHAANALATLAKSDSDVIVEIGENTASFQLGEILLTTRKIEGNYPNYNQIIPKQFTENATIGREEFLELSKAASSSADDKSFSAIISLTKHSLSVSSKGDSSESSGSIDTNYNGPDFKIAIDPKKLIEVLSTIPDDEFQLKWIDELSPLAFVAGNFLNITMPMRLS